MNEPEYLGRLDPGRRTSHPCINCLLETEERIESGDYGRTSTGDRIWYGTYRAEIRELKRVLRHYNPRRLIEIGAGSGRIIRTILETLPGSEITGIEKDERTFNLVSKRFSDEGRVRIEQTDISDYLSNGHQYDMAICLMNTFGNINNPRIFNQIVDHARLFVFSLYNREFDEQRKLMYQARGHSNFSFIQGQYCFEDDWVRGLVSRSYTEEEIRELSEKSGAELLELKLVELLFFAVARRK